MSPPRMQRLFSERRRELSYICIHRRLYAKAARPAPASPRSNGSTGTKTTANTKPPTSKPNKNESAAVAEAIRSARERESALRAARMRRQGQREDREKEQAQKEVEKKAYQKRYNTAARKWVSSIIALPIFLVTSYYLFDRLALGNVPKPLPKAPKEELSEGGGEGDS